MSNRPDVTGFYDKRTGSIQYVVGDPETKMCAVIDPVLDYDEKSGSTATVNADTILNFVSQRGYQVQWILDTHPHADHFPRPLTSNREQARLLQSAKKSFKSKTLGKIL